MFEEFSDRGLVMARGDVQQVARTEKYLQHRAAMRHHVSVQGERAPVQVYALQLLNVELGLVLVSGFSGVKIISQVLLSAGLPVKHLVLKDSIFIPSHPVGLQRPVFFLFDRLWTVVSVTQAESHIERSLVGLNWDTAEGKRVLSYVRCHVFSSDVVLGVEPGEVNSHKDDDGEESGDSVSETVDGADGAALGHDKLGTYAKHVAVLHGSP